MEIKLTDRQKIFLEGVIRSCAFLVVMRELFTFALEYIVIPVTGALFFLCSLVIRIEGSPQDDPDGTIVALIIFAGILILFILTTYVLAKLCGINKYFSQFKFWKSIFLLCITSVILFYFYLLNLHTLKFNNNIFWEAFIVATIIPSYLTYLFFNFLTKKFPTPFEQIGYFFSNQFYIGLFKKIQKKCKKD